MSRNVDSRKKVKFHKLSTKHLTEYQKFVRNMMKNDDIKTIQKQTDRMKKIGELWNIEKNNSTMSK